MLARSQALVERGALHGNAAPRLLNAFPGEARPSAARTEYAV